MRTYPTTLLATLTLAVAVGCSDPDTADDRGYTKAPLEQPGWIVEGEQATEMDELGDPILIPSAADLRAARNPVAMPGDTAAAAGDAGAAASDTTATGD